MRADNDRQIPIQMRDEFKGAMNCNGNGLCFNFDEHSIMCPSMKVSKNRVFSPKGRAAMVREWLRLMANENVSSTKGIGLAEPFAFPNSPTAFYAWRKYVQ